MGEGTGSHKQIAAIAQRITFEGHLITNTIQDDKCYGCGMGLCDPREWHPHIACETFKREHDGRKVWVVLHDLIENGVAPWL